MPEHSHLSKSKKSLLILLSQTFRNENKNKESTEPLIKELQYPYNFCEKMYQDNLPHNSDSNIQQWPCHVHPRRRLCVPNHVTTTFDAENIQLLD
jgi:hypothetical protein